MIKNLFVVLIFVLSALMTSCTTKQILQVEDSEEMLKIEDYDKTMKVKQINEPIAVPELVVLDEKTPTIATPVDPSSPKIVPKAKPVKPAVVVKPKVKQPDLEDGEGFDGRRPIVDPFRPGEKVTMKLSYFNITAGHMDIEVLPFKEVNGKKAYHFRIKGKSNSFFESIYSVDDSGETFMDYETMLPYNMSIDVKETKQLRTVRSYFDWKRKKGVFWEKKITKKSGLEEKKYEWEILPYSQNIFSAIFYLRTFTLKPGKVISFRVADEKKNMVVKAHVVGIERVKTDIGEIETLKIKPEVEIGGIFKPIGDVFFYLTNDDRKMIVRLESKIKIGTIIGRATQIVR